MKRPVLVPLIRLLLSAILCGAAFTLSAVPRASHVFIISIDGGKPEVIRQASMPVLKQLVADGACTWTAQTIFPSVTLPAHTSMLTGVGPDKHLILWNDWMPAAGIVRVPTVFTLAKQAGLSTAMFVGKEKFRHLLQPGTVDEFDYDKAAAGQVITKEVAGKKVVETGTVLAGTVAKHAASYILTNKPNLCFIHFTDPDDVGHEYGWGSPQQLQAFSDVDAALGEVLHAIKTAGISQESVVIITADHGGHKKTHGTRLPDDMNIPWIVWGKNVKKGYAITTPVNTVYTAATTLWLLDLPLPESFDGKPVTNAFALPSAVVTSPINPSAPAAAETPPNPSADN